MTMTGGAGIVPAEANSLRMGIKAYHGSPHDFDKFSLDKIGTGEGAQAYGHGLYFAENEGVAKSYRDALAKKNQRPVNLPNDGNPFSGGQILEQDPTRPGRMYEVNINADPAHFLDWDKPLSAQTDAIKERATKAYGITPDQMHDLQFARPKTPEDAARLKDAGIPGIKYLDQGSRAAGDGSRNYVVFNDKLIDIVKKYAAAGIALPPAIAAEYAQQFKPVDHDPFEGEQ